MDRGQIKAFECRNEFVIGLIDQSGSLFSGNKFQIFARHILFFNSFIFSKVTIKRKPNTSTRECTHNCISNKTCNFTSICQLLHAKTNIALGTLKEKLCRNLAH